MTQPSKPRRLAGFAGWPQMNQRSGQEDSRLRPLRLERSALQANKLDVPYQSLMKVWLTEKLREANG